MHSKTLKRRLKDYNEFVCDCCENIAPRKGQFKVCVLCYGKMLDVKRLTALRDMCLNMVNALNEWITDVEGLNEKKLRETEV